MTQEKHSERSYNKERRKGFTVHVIVRVPQQFYVPFMFRRLIKRIDRQEWDFSFEHSSSDIPRALYCFRHRKPARNMNSPWLLLCDCFSVCWENLTIMRKVDVQYPRQFRSHVHNNWLIVNGLLVRNVTTLFCSFEVINCCRIEYRWYKVSYMHVQLELFFFGIFVSQGEHLFYFPIKKELVKNEPVQVPKAGKCQSDSVMNFSAVLTLTRKHFVF